MWRIEHDPEARTIRIQLIGEVDAPAMRALARAHAEALEATGGQPFSVLGDLRGLHPLDAEALAIFQDMKRVAAQLEGYRRRAILADGATVAMQQRNATLDEGGDRTELVTFDEAQARRHLDPDR